MKNKAINDSQDNKQLNYNRLVLLNSLQIRIFLQNSNHNSYFIETFFLIILFFLYTNTFY